MRVETEKDGLRTELILPFVSLQVFLREVGRDPGGGNRKLALFKAVYGVTSLKDDPFFGLAPLILRARLRSQCGAHVRRRTSIAQRQAELDIESIGRKIQAAKLVQRIPQATAGDGDGSAATAVNLVAAATAGVVEGAEVQVRLHPIHGDAQVGEVNRRLLFQRGQFGTRLHRRFGDLLYVRRRRIAGDIGGFCRINVNASRSRTTLV